MNAFEHGLRQARARQRRFYLAAAGIFALAVVALAGALILASGTAVTVLPEEAARDATIAVEEGLAVAVDGVVYGLSAAPAIRVAAPGFRERRRTIAAEERGGRIAVALEALPGRIVATTAPAHPDTRWSLDGRLLAVGEAFEREVEHGEYRLSADNPYFAAAERKVAVARGATAELSLPLDPVAGSIALDSEPQGAAVTLDGKAAGETPLVLSVEGGEHAVSLAMEGFVAVEERIAVTRDAPANERRYRLRPEPARLVVMVEPAGGHLLLDGRRVAPAQPHEIESGRDHTVSYMLDGHRGQTRTLALAPHEQRTLRLRLEPEFGAVEIHAAPAAEILVDGRVVGTGRFVGELPAVPHAVLLRRPGYRTIEQTITPSPARATVIRAELLDELAARRAEAPREYTNAAGIAMRLFEPGRFVMGAPRHEKGQRANEFVREVALSKAFYAGTHEVTNEQFGRFRPGRPGRPGEPATGLAWIEAAAFCNWLSAKEGLAPFYRIDGGRLAGVAATADGYRLLSEAEWEWLARKAGRPAQTVFPWGDEAVVPEMAGNIADEAANGLTDVYVPGYTDGYAGLAPVGRFPAEASGLFDLTGNVSEWVHDHYSLEPPAAGAVHADPLGPDYGDTHVIKGSSWRSGTRTALRAAWREGLAGGRDDVGFRIGRYLYGAEARAAR